MGTTAWSLVALCCCASLSFVTSRGTEWMKDGGHAGAAAGSIGVAAVADHSLRWYPVRPTATGGDCHAACTAKGLAPVSSGSPSAVVCAVKYTPSPPGPVFYRDEILSGTKADGRGCSYTRISATGASAAYIEAKDASKSYLCGCAQSKATVWRSGVAGCPPDHLNTYMTCRFKKDDAYWIGWMNTQGSCLFSIPRVGQYAAPAAFDILCDKRSPTVYKTGVVTWHAVRSSGDCAATCKAAGKEMVGAGSPGVSLCVDAISKGFPFPSAYAHRPGSIPWLPARGCFLADTQEPKLECPLASPVYHCACQSPAKRAKWKPILPVNGGLAPTKCIRPVKLPSAANSIEGPPFAGGQMLTVCRANVGGVWLPGFYAGGNTCRTLKPKSASCAGEFYVGPAGATPDFQLLCEA